MRPIIQTQFIDPNTTYTYIAFDIYTKTNLIYYGQTCHYVFRANVSMSQIGVPGHVG
ncbi:hypothetical protein BgiMline_012539, partial [Biomphalaria glabrata]